MLHTIKYGESAVVAYLLTDTFGRQNYLVQGVRSVRGHGNRASLLQPMFLLAYADIASHRSELHRMRDVCLAEPLKSIPFDQRKSAIALFMAETLYKLVREVEPNRELFDFVRAAVIALDRENDPMAVANFHLWFIVRLAGFLGFRPSNEWSEGSSFDILEGTFVHIAPRHNIIIHSTNAVLLGKLMHITAEELCSIQLSRLQRADFLASMVAYLGYHLDTIGRIQSLKILAELF